MPAHTSNDFTAWIQRLLSVIILACLLSSPTVETIAPILRGMKPFWRHQNQLGMESESRDLRRAEAAYSFLRNVDCEHVTFTSSKECERIVQLPKEAILVYMATQSPYGRFLSTIPDERLSRGHVHDAVLVLDPYPEVSFGHVLLIFFIDSSISRTQCQKKDGIYLDEDECMHLAVRRRCKNFLERRSRRRNFAKRCEINFIPTVHLDSDRNLIKTNYLACRSDLGSFHQCPVFRPINESSRLLCDPLRDNSQSCSTSHETVRTSCRVFEVCDQAVIISGGWNRLTTDLTHKENVISIYQLFRRNGFKRRNIKLFYANGEGEFKIPNESPHRAHSAAMKMAFRSHMQTMCASRHCVDSLVLYLNSPAMHDGTMLLWDVNQDGLVQESEQYTIDELLLDVADCSAKHVQIIVDQSYSGEIAYAVKNSKHHENVIVLTNGKGMEYSYDSEFTQFWSTQNDTRACTTTTFREISDMTENSSPIMANTGNIRATLSGAPCDVTPPFSNRELRREYFGCQNLPTAVWLRDIWRDSGTDDDGWNLE